MGDATRPDPVIDAYARHVDRSLLRENLRRTPQARLDAMINMLNLSEQLRKAVSGSRAKNP